MRRRYGSEDGGGHDAEGIVIAVGVSYGNPRRPFAARLFRSASENIGQLRGDMLRHSPSMADEQRNLDAILSTLKVEHKRGHRSARLSRSVIVRAAVLDLLSVRRIIPAWHRSGPADPDTAPAARCATGLTGSSANSEAISRIYELLEHADAP